MTQFFQIVFGQQVLTNIEKQYEQREEDMHGACCTRKRLRYFIASTLDYNWSWSSSHRSTSAHADELYLVVGTSENTTCTLPAGRVVFSYSLSVFSSINVYVDFTQTPTVLVLDEASCG